MVISIDYNKNQAIRTVHGKEERQKLTPDPISGFAMCTWNDGSLYKSSVPNLMLEERPPLRAKKRPAASKKPAAAEGVSTAEDDEKEEGEEEEEEEVEFDPDSVVEPVAKKAKTAEEDKKGKEKEEAAEDLPCTTPNPQFPEANCPRHMHVLSTNKKAASLLP